MTRKDLAQIVCVDIFVFSSGTHSSRKQWVDEATVICPTGFCICNSTFECWTLSFTMDIGVYLRKNDNYREKARIQMKIFVSTRNI